MLIISHFLQKAIVFVCFYEKIFLRKVLHFYFVSAIVYEQFFYASKEVLRMAKCDVCGKGVTFGIKVSHSHRRSNRTWKPNVVKVKAIVNGSPKRINVCTRCLRSGKVTRAVWSRIISAVSAGAAGFILRRGCDRRNSPVFEDGRFFVLPKVLPPLFIAYK